MSIRLVLLFLCIAVLYGKDFKRIEKYIHTLDQKILQLPSEHNSSLHSIASVVHSSPVVKQAPLHQRKKKSTAHSHPQSTLQKLQIKMVIARRGARGVLMTQDGQILREKEYYHGCKIAKISLWKVLFVCGYKRVEIPVGMKND